MMIIVIINSQHIPWCEPQETIPQRLVLLTSCTAYTQKHIVQSLINQVIYSKGVLFVALGPPGAGKADLARTLADATGRTHLSVGLILREEAKQETEQGQSIKEAIKTGMLVATVCRYALVFALVTAIFN